MKIKEQLPKEKAIYQAVLDLFQEGVDLNSLTVAEITGKAGIGKGTAYEYFADKEEMIAKAIFFGTEEFCRRVYDSLKKENGLYDKIYRILIKMEQEVREMSCILRMIHLMSDNSAISKKIRHMMKEKSEQQILPLDIVQMIILDEWKGKRLPDREKAEYLGMRIFSGILCYGMYMEDGSKSEEAKETIRELTCRGICREVEEIEK